mgnify:CR=1 FL=1
MPGRTARPLGQVFTPPAVAGPMTAWAVAQRPRRILDPCLGRGIFVQCVAELRHRGIVPRDAEVQAYELDPRMVLAYRAGAARRGDLRVRVTQGDFLRSRPAGRFDAAICNPPYVRHHEHDVEETLFRRFDRLVGARLSRLTNTYGLFLLRIWSLLAEGGRAAIITPAEWLNADFGCAIKRYLLAQNAIDGILQFDHATGVFDGVLTTAAITLLRRGRGDDEPVRLRGVRSAAELERFDGGLAYAPSQLDPSAKWSPLFERRLRRNGRVVALGDVARCVRGIATGANRYFVLKPSELAVTGIDRADVTPCISKAAQVVAPRLTAADMRRLIAADERVLLLTPREPLRPAVRQYLALGRRLGVHRRYLPRHRPRWYQPERREPAPIWVNVFARGAFRFVRNEAGVLHLTAFHAIYPRAGVDSDGLHAALCDVRTQAELQREMRIYGGGLRKLEPRDVERIGVADPLRRLRCETGQARGRRPSRHACRRSRAMTSA